MNFSKISLFIILLQARGNAFAALCTYGKNAQKMLFSACDLVKRTFSNMGIGFSFNTELGKGSNNSYNIKLSYQIYGNFKTN